MKRLRRILVGYRDDLELSSRWWHRLLKVLFVISAVVCVFGGIILAAAIEPVKTIVPNVTYTDLDSYIKHASKDVANLIPGFLALEGSLGRLDAQNDRIDFLFTSDLTNNRFCNRDAYRHIDALLTFVNKDAEAGKAQTIEGLKTELTQRGIIEGEGMCLILAAGKDLPDDKYIISYKIRRSAQLSAFSKWLSIGVLATALWWLLMSNLYYRGFVYIVCGRRKTNPSGIIV
jgi:hypothetical protein